MSHYTFKKRTPAKIEACRSEQSHSYVIWAILLFFSVLSFVVFAGPWGLWIIVSADKDFVLSQFQEIHRATGGGAYSADLRWADWVISAILSFLLWAAPLGLILANGKYRKRALVLSTCFVMLFVLLIGYGTGVDRVLVNDEYIRTRRR